MSTTDAARIAKEPAEVHPAVPALFDLPERLQTTRVLGALICAEDAAFKEGAPDSILLRPAVRAALLAMVVALAGCAIAPDTLRIEGQHVSHLTQHFGAEPTDYGYNDLALELHWQRGHWFGDLSEGVVLNGRDTKVNGPCYGGLWGPREVFQARAGWEVSLR